MATTQTKKPSRSGPNITNAQRKRPLFTTTLDPLAIDTIKAGAEAEGISVAQWVERAVFAYAGRAADGAIEKK